MKIHHECANCCRGFDTSLILHEILIEVPSKSSSSRGGTRDGFDAQIIKVNKILSSIFKLDYVNNLPAPSSSSSSGQHSHPDGSTGDDSSLFDLNFEMAVCDECGKLLKILHKALEELNCRREKRSLLAKRIGKLDGIMHEIQETWSQMAVQNDQQDPIDEEDKDADNFCQLDADVDTDAPRHLESDPLEKLTKISSLTTKVEQQQQKNNNNNNKFAKKSKLGMTQGTQAKEEKGFNEKVGEGNFDEPKTVQVRPPVKKIFVEGDNDDGDVPPKTKKFPAKSKGDLECTLCKNCFVTPADLVDHLCKDHVMEDHHCLCPLCNRTMSSSAYLRLHLNRHVGHHPFICTFSGCTAKYPAKPDLYHHVKCAHGPNGRIPADKYQASSTSTNVNLNCPICLEGHGTEIHLSQHLYDVHTKENPSKCPLCSKIMGKRGPLKMHITRHFVTKMTREKEERLAKLAKSGKNRKKLVCHICSKTYKYRGLLKMHLKTHDDHYKLGLHETRQVSRKSERFHEEDEAGSSSETDSVMEIVDVEQSQRNLESISKSLEMPSEDTTMETPNVIAWNVDNNFVR